MSHRGRVLVIEETPRPETRRLWEGIRAEGWDVHSIPLAQTVDHARRDHPDVVVLNFAGTDGAVERTRYLDAAARMSMLRGARRLPVIAVDETPHPEERPIGIADVIRAPWSVGHVSSRLGALARLATMRAEIVRRLETANRFGLSAPEPDLSILPEDDAHILVVGAGIRYFTIERALSKRATLVGAFTVDTAVDYLERRPFDAAVLNLPLEDAADFLGLVRRNPDTYDLPAVVLTGETDPRLIEAVHDAGATDVVFADESERTFAERVETVMTEHRLRRTLKGAYGDLRHETTLDAATGLYRRAFLMEHLAALIDDARDDGDPIAVIGLRILDLAGINAEWGWAAGDRLLAQIGAMIARLVRGEDLAARAGGDRLALVLPSSDADDAALVAQRIVGILETTAFSVPGSTAPLWVGFDVLTTELEDGDDPAALLARAWR